MTNAHTSRFGFPKEKRLLTRRDFQRVLSRGRRAYTRRFILYAHPGSTSVSRVGITVSRKVGNAVKRNRIKRCIREAFRTHPEWFQNPMDLVVIAKRKTDRDDANGVSSVPFQTDAVSRELIHGIEHILSGGKGGKRGHG